jgi:hypothetical protein
LPVASPSPPNGTVTTSNTAPKKAQRFNGTKQEEGIRSGGKTDETGRPVDTCTPSIPQANDNHRLCPTQARSQSPEKNHMTANRRLRGASKSAMRANETTHFAKTLRESELWSKLFEQGFFLEASPCRLHGSHPQAVAICTADRARFFSDFFDARGRREGGVT